MCWRGKTQKQEDKEAEIKRLKESENAI